MAGTFPGRIHFVGIGGIGMSGIAELLHNLGFCVSGSDVAASAITRRLAALGIHVYRGHAASHAAGAKLLVRSTAVGLDNPEIAAARERGIPVLGRGRMLGELARLKKTVSVAGSHGKTTTTAMVAMALKAAGARPTMVVGGQLKNIHGNAKLGLGDYLVAEADESDASFLHLEPLVAVLTNIDDDHLDFHKTMDNLKEAFQRHLEHLPFYGAAVVCADDPAALEAASRAGRTVITYGVKAPASGRAAPLWQARNIKMTEAGSRFDAFLRGRRACRVSLRVPGAHNVQNALAALAAGSFLGFSPSLLARGLAEFLGVGRRMERLGRAGRVEFLDDYGHHPTEIAATLSAVKSLWRPKRLLVVFQPHRYTRTKRLAARFAPAFKRADLVYVADVYPAGEKPIPGGDAGAVISALKRAGVPCEKFPGALAVSRQLRPGDILLTQGAGDVWKIGLDLLRRMR